MTIQYHWKFVTCRILRYRRDFDKVKKQGNQNIKGETERQTERYETDRQTDREEECAYES